MTQAQKLTLQLAQQTRFQVHSCSDYISEYGLSVKQTQRHQQILAQLKQHGFVSTEELVASLDVSPQTIRRDLNSLASEQRIERHHGGASLISSSVVNDSYSSRKIKHAQSKEAIAKALVKQIPNGASLFLDIGTTSETIAKALLQHHGLRIVTNNIHVASLLMNKPDFKVLLAGGEIRNKDGGIVGEATMDFIRQFRLDFGIVTVSGIDDDGSLLDFDYHEVRVTQAIIDSARKVILAADHSKFGRNAMINIGNITQVDQLISDQRPAEDLCQVLASHNIDMLIAEPC